MIRRREFIAGLGGAAASWPVAASAQQTGKLPTIGCGKPRVSLMERRFRAAASRTRLDRKGRTVAIEYRYTEGRTERYPEIAAEFVRLKVDVIASSAAGAYAAKEATSVIPIVVLVMHDPIGTGLVPNLARPGGNVTGLSAQNTDTAGKRLEQLRKAVPGLRRLAIHGRLSWPREYLCPLKLDPCSRKRRRVLRCLFCERSRKYRHVDQLQVRAFSRARRRYRFGRDGRSDAERAAYVACFGKTPR